jgi:hypothetical protein
LTRLNLFEFFSKPHCDFASLNISDRAASRHSKMKRRPPAAVEGLNARWHFDGVGGSGNRAL